MFSHDLFSFLLLLLLFLLVLCVCVFCMSGGWLCWDSIQHVLVLVSDSEYVVQFELSRLVEDCFVLFFYFHVTTSCLIAVVLGCFVKLSLPYVSIPQLFELTLHLFSVSFVYFINLYFYFC